jgi:hypothetical protein
MHLEVEYGKERLTGSSKVELTILQREMKWKRGEENNKGSKIGKRHGLGMKTNNIKHKNDPPITT